MRNPAIVLDTLANQTTREGYRFKKLYRNLYNPEFFLIAYAKTYANQGNMTQGSDGQTIDGMSMERIERLIDKLKDYSYQPKPSKRVFIPKKNGSKRPLGIPSFEDKLVQEVVRMILESIYEGTFSESSHGFRPKKSCHTALDQIKYTFTGSRWFVEGDIKGFFDNIDHQTLVQLLRKKIADEYFLHLIWKFLKAGYLEEWKFYKTFSGTPQGGIISPILSNIYLHELDTFMHNYKKIFDKGKNRKRSREYRNREAKLSRRRKKYRYSWNVMTPEEKQTAYKEVQELRKHMMEIPYKDPMDDGYRRIQYVRYADDFLIGITGSKEDCYKVKEDITRFLNETLSIELSQEKTLVTNSKKRARFLGYDVTVSRSQSSSKPVGSQYNQRSLSLKCDLLMPHEVWRNKLIEYKAMEIDPITHKWKSTHRSYLLPNDDLEILATYNAEIRGFYNYYKLANNVYTLDGFKHMMEYSMYKTFASKYKLSVKKILSKYKISGQFGVKYSTSDGLKISYLYNKGFKKQSSVSVDNHVDSVPATNELIYNKSGLIKRLRANQCEWCSKETTNIEIHHVKKLKDLKGKKRWEKRMIERKRKTLALCKECHLNLHTGKLD
ncbi:maturase (plasmid) [Bacillaceae bacterium JMAK1]|nr:maturase [Bacillaceae bacterium JMAK1]